MEGSNPVQPSDNDALLVNAWVVSDGRQDEFIESIDELFAHLRGLEGFVEGAILRGANPTRFVSYARMRTARDRQRLYDDERVSEWMAAIEPIARGELHSYEVLSSFAPDQR
jgi:hypothetical protein